MTGSLQRFVFPFLVPYLLGLIHIALMGSIYTTIAVVTEWCVTNIDSGLLFFRCDSISSRHPVTM